MKYKVKDKYKNKPAPKWYGSGMKGKPMWGEGGFNDKDIEAIRAKSESTFKKYFEEAPKVKAVKEA